MQEPIITFLKERISKGYEYKHCCLCRYGRKVGVILWRAVFKGEMLGFHWLLCNRCRFLMFTAMGGKRMKVLASEDAPTWANRLVKKPKQKVSDRGRVRTSEYYAMSPDRQEAVDKGIPLPVYEKDPAAYDLETGKAIKRKKKDYTRCDKCNDKILKTDAYYAGIKDKEFCKSCAWKIAKKRKRKAGGTAKIKSELRRKGII